MVDSFPHEETPSTDEFIKGLWRENPVFVQVLGMCPALAVSNTARNALAMGLATLFVLLMSNVVISSLRRFVPKEVRIATYILVIATFVTIVDYVLQAISLDLHKALGAFISLIVVPRGRARWTRSAWAWASPPRCSASGPCGRSSAAARSSACRSSTTASSPGS
jgi:Na+-transporting NADH:ubiquinone oxidoreductase subunit NqrD